MKVSLKKFDPDVLADHETRMWVAYYNHQFFKLFVLLVITARIQFHFSYFKALRAAYYAAFAAGVFRLDKGRENKEKVLKNLVSFYKIVHSQSLEDFDYQKVAELEWHWWMVDRYPDKYQMTREQAMANAVGEMYGVPPEKMEGYAKYRALGEVLKDQADAENTEVDWTQVNIALRKAYHSLHEVF